MSCIEEEKTVDILYSSSDSYAFLTGISILSLLENNKASDSIHIYIMDNHISEENKAKLTEVVNYYGRRLSFVAMPDMKELTGQEIDTRDGTSVHLVVCIWRVSCHRPFIKY